MAVKLRQNITGTVTQALITAGSNVNNISEILLTNVHATDAATVDLYVADATNSFYIIKNTEVPFGTSLLLNSKSLKFINTTGAFGLFIKLGAGSVDVHIKRES